MKYFIPLFYFITLSFISKCQTQIINTNTSEVLNVISVIDHNIIIGGKNSYIAKSTDECNNVSFINSPVSLGDWSQIHRVDTDIIFLFSRSGLSTNVYKSIDGGNSWVQKLSVDSVIGDQFALYDSLEAIVFCSQYKCLHSYDGGDNWVLEYSPTAFATSISTFGDSTTAIGIVNGCIISKDRGHNWTSSTTSFPGATAHQRSFYFLTIDTILSVSVDNIGHKFLSCSTDTGLTWTHRDFIDPPYFNPYDLYFFNLNEGYVVGNNSNNTGVIYKTVDTGLTWTMYDTQLPSIFGQIKFINDSIALISGNDGTLIKWNKHSYVTEVLNFESTILDINIYPNPVTNLQTIELKNITIEPITIELFDFSGRKLVDVYNGHSTNGKAIIKSDISRFSSGVYYYKIQAGDRIKNIKITKQ